MSPRNFENDFKMTTIIWRIVRRIKNFKIVKLAKTATKLKAKIRKKFQNYGSKIAKKPSNCQNNLLKST